MVHKRHGFPVQGASRFVFSNTTLVLSTNVDVGLYILIYIDLMWYLLNIIIQHCGISTKIWDLYRGLDFGDHVVGVYITTKKTQW